MRTHRTVIRASVGVRLERVVQLDARGVVEQRYFILRTLRPKPARIIADEAAAMTAFDNEVIASLADPVASTLAASVGESFSVKH